MRTERIALGLALAIGGIVAQEAASAEDYRGTMEQQMACTPDVWRLCSSQIPDVNRIVACLQQNTTQLERMSCGVPVQQPGAAAATGPAQSRRAAALQRCTAASARATASL